MAAALPASSGHAAGRAPVDLVYTWVDDSLPGFSDELKSHASSAHDLNPNRTRDNLDLLRYSLRGVEMHAPWVRHIYLLTKRPQVPHWLRTDHPRLRLVHHDQVIDPAHLPTFNSFAIISHLHLLPGLAERFIYLEDDMVFGAPVTPDDFVGADGRIRVFTHFSRTTPAAQRHDESLSPWNRALGEVNHRLDGAFGAQPRVHVNHVPLWVERRVWGEMLERFADATALTCASRFRASGNIAPEYLYPNWLLATGLGRAEPRLRTLWRAMYMPLENNRPLAWALTTLAALRRPRFLTLNDNFDQHPDPRVVARVRRYLESAWPRPSSFERAT